MWALAATRGASEFLVRDQLSLETFLPYTREKQIISVMPPRTTSTPRPRMQHKAVWINVARWPGYIFARVRSNEDLNTLAATRGVIDLVRTGGGEPATLSDRVLSTLRQGCSADGQVLRAAELHQFGVGDLLRFVAKSSLAGHSGMVVSIEDSGYLRLLVDGKHKATAHYSELTSAIG